MRLSVVIPALNEAANIGRAVESARLAGAAEILVADGGSRDETVQLAAAAGAMVVSSAGGRAVQQNAGAKLATGDVLLFLHADNWLAAGVAGQIETALKNPERTHGALWQRIDAEGSAYRLLEIGNAARIGLFGLPYGDQAIFVRRDVFQEIGGFAEVPLMEDVLLSQRLRHRSRPLLLAGPVHVSARRWQRHGIVRQTLRNWRIVAEFALGASPERLAGRYRRHDTDESTSPTDATPS